MPAERAAPPRGLEVRPRQVKAWLATLPLAKSLEAANHLTAHLASLNRSKIDVDDRIEILESYREVANTVLDELDAAYAKAGLPLGPRALEALALARKLALELAAGCKIAIAEKSGKRLAFGTKKHLPALVLRAMEYLARELGASYKSYTPVPPEVWNEMHQAYLFAEREGIATEPVGGEGGTVTDAYCEALLLSLADPYRLVPGDSDRITAQIRALRGLVTLGRARPSTPPGGHFLVPCDTDKGPKPILSSNDDAGGPNWRVLDANPLVEKMRARKNAHETGNVSQTTSRSVSPETLALLGKLIGLWGNPPKRASRRDPRETSVAICVGLKSVSHFVSLEPTVAAAASEAAAIRAGITIPLLAVADDEASKAFPVHEWDVVNQSDGGVKVRRTSDMLQPLVVGEVVAMKFIGRPRWTIGVARWITQVEEGGLEFGVQFLSCAARAVWVQPGNSSSPQAKLGIVFADEGATQALLTLPGMFAEGRAYDLTADGEITTVTAASLIERTARFDLFDVSAG